MNDSIATQNSPLSSSSENGPEHLAKTRRGITTTIWLILIFISVVLGLFYNKLSSPRVLSPTDLKANGAYLFSPPRALKDFNLTHHSQQPFTLENLQGQWSLIFMGFTSCPHICPTTLATLNQTYKMLEKDIAEQTQVVMVSVDPERDSAEKMAEYMGHFNAAFHGARADQAETSRFARQIAAAYQRLPSDDSGHYEVDHSGYIFVVNPKGHLHGFLKPPFDTNRLKLTFQSMVTAF